MKTSTAPKQWHIHIVELEPRLGTQPGQQRLCLAIQPTVFAQSGLKSTMVLPLTTRLVEGDAFPLRVRIPAHTCRLSQTSEILVDQILAWDNALFREDLGELPEALQDK